MDSFWMVPGLLVWPLAVLSLNPLRACQSQSLVLPFSRSDSFSLPPEPSLACFWPRKPTGAESDSSPRLRAGSSEPLLLELPERDWEHPRTVFNISPRKKSFSYMSQTWKVQRIKARKVLGVGVISASGCGGFSCVRSGPFFLSYLRLTADSSQLTRDCMFIPIIKNIWQASGNAFLCQGNETLSPVQPGL